MTDSSSRPIRPLSHAYHHGDQLRPWIWGGSEVSGWTDSGLEVCLFFNTSVTLESSSSTSRSRRRRLLPQWGRTFRARRVTYDVETSILTGRVPEVPTCCFFVETKSGQACVVDQSQLGIVGDMCFVRPQCLLQLHHYRATIHSCAILSCCYYFIIIAELFNRCQVNQWIVIYLNWFCCWLINHVFFPSKAFRWRTSTKKGFKTHFADLFSVFPST